MARLNTAGRLGLAVLLGATYFVSFRGLTVVATTRNPVAFADSSHYVQLLSERHYIACAEPDVPHNIEHRRKTIHHAGYVLFADAVVQAGRLVAPAVSELDLIWLVSPVLGAVNFLLAYSLFRRWSPRLALPGALAYALTPATWIYASIPETWTLVGTAVLIALLLREHSVSLRVAIPVIAVLALTNFLILLLVLLFQDPRQPLPARIRRLAWIGVTTGLLWVGLLVILGVTLTPDFLPQHFYHQTVSFKGRMGEHLAVWHPLRWAYTFVNGFILPFVLNQHDLNFGRYALLDSARTFPLGTGAVIGFIVLAGFVIRQLWVMLVPVLRVPREAMTLVSGQGLYLLLAFVASGLALYYESFLYSPLFLPILFGFALQSLAASPRARPLMWSIAAIWIASSAQQIVYFRGALGG